MADSLVSDSYRPFLLYDSYALRGLYFKLYNWESFFVKERRKMTNLKRM